MNRPASNLDQISLRILSCLEATAASPRAKLAAALERVPTEDQHGPSEITPVALIFQSDPSENPAKSQFVK
jgi:hypothetical protein